MLPDFQFLELMEQALQSEVGIKVETNSPEVLVQRLSARRKLSPHYAGLTFSVSPTNPTGEVWIIKRTKEDAGTTKTHSSS